MNWIRFQDRLPGHNEKIIVWDSEWSDPFMTTFKAYEKWAVTRYTHWMPAPGSPDAAKETG